MSYDFDSLLKTFVDHYNQDEYLYHPIENDGQNQVTLSFLFRFVEESGDEMTPGDDSTWKNDLFTIEEGRFIWDVCYDRLP